MARCDLSQTCLRNEFCGAAPCTSEQRNDVARLRRIPTVKLPVSAELWKQELTISSAALRFFAAGGTLICSGGGALVAEVLTIRRLRSSTMPCRQRPRALFGRASNDVVFSDGMVCLPERSRRGCGPACSRSYARRRPWQHAIFAVVNR